MLPSRPGGRLTTREAVLIQTDSILQLPNHCGPACLAILARKCGLVASQEALGRIAKTDKDGTTLAGMVRAALALGYRVSYRDNASIEDLRSLLGRGAFLIVDWFCEVVGHYSIVVEVTQDSILLRDPVMSELRELSLETFEQVWFDFDGEKPEPGAFFVRRVLILE